MVFCGVMAATMALEVIVCSSSWSLSLDAKDKKLGEVLDQLAAESGYSIVYDQQWSDISISVQLTNESLESALNRVLKGLDYAMVLNESQKRIKLYIFGSKTSLRQSGGGIGRSPAASVPPRSAPHESVGKTRKPASDMAQDESRQPAAGYLPSPAKAPRPSISGSDTRFDQATSTITE